MKNTIVMILVAILLLSSFVKVPAFRYDWVNPLRSGFTIYVDDDNVEGPWDGSSCYPYKYIQDGINNASSDDTVFVRNGLYYENIIVNKKTNAAL